MPKPREPQPQCINPPTLRGYTLEAPTITMAMRTQLMAAMKMTVRKSRNI